MIDGLLIIITVYSVVSSRSFLAVWNCRRQRIPIPCTPTFERMSRWNISTYVHYICRLSESLWARFRKPLSSRNIRAYAFFVFFLVSSQRNHDESSHLRHNDLKKLWGHLSTSYDVVNAKALVCKGRRMRTPLSVEWNAALLFFVLRSQSRDASQPMGRQAGTYTRVRSQWKFFWPCFRHMAAFSLNWNAGGGKAEGGIWRRTATRCYGQYLVWACRW